MTKNSNYSSPELVLVSEQAQTTLCASNISTENYIQEDYEW